MAYWIDLTTVSDSRGVLHVVDKVLPFDIRRIFYLHKVTNQRGGHRHHNAIQALISISGSCEVFVNDGVNKTTFLLDSPSKCLLLEPKDWHTMDNFTDGAVLLVISSEHYNVEDYIDEPYPD